MIHSPYTLAKVYFFFHFYFCPYKNPKVLFQFEQGLHKEIGLQGLVMSFNFYIKEQIS